MDYYPLTAMRTTAYTGNGIDEDEMPVHTIAQEYNSIYRYGFQVHTPASGEYDGTMEAYNTQSGSNRNTIYYSAWNWENMITYINTNPSTQRNPCTQLNVDGESGWRLPNIKELAIMKNLGIITNGNAPYLSCSMGVIASGNGQRLANVSDAPTTNGGNRYTNGSNSNNNTHNFMSTVDDGRITQAWTSDSYHIRCVRDYTGGN